MPRTNPRGPLGDGEEHAVHVTRVKVQLVEHERLRTTLWQRANNLRGQHTAMSRPSPGLRAKSSVGRTVIGMRNTGPPSVLSAS